MRIFFTITILLFPFITFGEALKTSVTYDVSFKETQVNWNIASDLTGQSSPNVISELSWLNLHSANMGLGLTLIQDDYFLKMDGRYGFIFSGTNQDSDYNLDNRQGEFFRSINNSGRGYLLDGTIQYGKLLVLSDRLKGFASLGYQINRQHLKMYDGRQIIGSADLTGLDSLYQVDWYGPRIEIGVGYRLNRHAVHASAAYSDIEIDGYSDWNLRQDLSHPKSMTQFGEGIGQELKVSYQYALNEWASWSVDLSQKSFKASGIHTFHLADGTRSSQRLNQLKWNENVFGLKYKNYF